MPPVIAVKLGLRADTNPSNSILCPWCMSSIVSTRTHSACKLVALLAAHPVEIAIRLTELNEQKDTRQLEVALFLLNSVFCKK